MEGVTRMGTLLLLLSSIAASVSAGTPEVPTIRVERQELEANESLRFLRENREFLRGQLDRLRTRTEWHRSEARTLTARQQWLRGLGDELDAARDSLDRERVRLERRSLLQRIEELAAIETRLDHLDSLLSAQADRLHAIERDYLDRQETAMALLATGLPDDEAVAILVHDVDGDPVRVALDAASRDALRRGAVATLLHDFVEPRQHELALSVERADGSVHGLGSLRIRTARDRLTFVQVDLESADDTETLASEVWTR